MRDRTWIPTKSGSPAVATVHRPSDDIATGWLVIVPSLGLEAEVSYRTLLALADAAAARGVCALLLDISGGGDGAHIDESTDIVGRWLDEVSAAVDLADTVAPDIPINVLGYRLGGAIVSRWRPREGVRVVVWEGVDGNGFIRRTKLLAKLEGVSGGTNDALFGTPISGAQVEALRCLRLSPPSHGAGTRIEADRDVAERIGLVPPHLAEVPRGAVAEIVGGLAVSEYGQDISTWRGTDKSEQLIAGRLIRETLITVGPQRLMGITSGPATEATRPEVLLFTPQGAERSSGPGGLWALACRRQAALGHVSVRCERRGIGLHDDVSTNREPNPYSASALDDVSHLVLFGQTLGDRTVLVGSCAGAWLSLAAARRVAVDAIVAFNVPDWTDQVGTFDQEFIDNWHGVSMQQSTPLALPTTARQILARNRLARSLAGALRSCRVALYGLPILRGLGPQTAVYLALSETDYRTFVASGGGGLRLGRHVRSLWIPGGIDHGFRCSKARAVALHFVEHALLTSFPRPRGRIRDVRGSA